MSRFACGSLLVGALLLSASCNSVNNVVTPAPETPSQEVERLADRVSVAPLFARAVDLVVQVVPHASGCPASFDLGNGMTGTGAVLDDIDAWGEPYQFCAYQAAGPLSSGGTTFQANIRFGVPVDICPAQSLCPFLVRDATLQWSGGSFAWHGGGSAVIDAGGAATNLNLDISTDQGAWHAAPEAFVFKVTESMDYEIRIDRQTGVGSISSVLAVLAKLAVNDGCVTVDFADPQKEDRTTCLW